LIGGKESTAAVCGFDSQRNVSLAMSISYRDDAKPNGPVRVWLCDEAEEDKERQRDPQERESADEVVVRTTARALAESKGALHDRRRYMLLGQTLAGMQVWDLRRSIHALRTIDGKIGKYKDSHLILEGRGDMAVVALYASLFEPNIAELRLYDLPASHADGPDLLNVLRSHDIPAAVAMAAERCPVRILGAKREGDWEYPKRVIEALGWDNDRGKKSPPRLAVEVAEAKAK
jgi:hypothetical protein